MNMVPFSIELFGGFGKCEGLLRHEGEKLVFEFENREALLGLIKSGVQKASVPLKDLVSVTISKGWLGNSWLGVTIVLQAARMEALQDVPGMKQGRVELSVARKDRHAAEKFVEGLHEDGDSGE